MAVVESASGAKRIAAAFSGHQRRAALMPYLMGGFPSTEESLRIAQAYIDGGADLIEFGLPFSDPLADGPVIHSAATAALEAGAVVEDVIGRIADVAAQVPTLLMTYYNLIEARGVERFLDRAVELGVSGMIVPDIPLEESCDLLTSCDSRGLALVPLVAPTTPDSRMERICAQARGFVYVVAVTGTTGERAASATGLDELVGRVRQYTELPIAVGFGISEPAQAGQVGELADGAIVGSRLVREVQDVRSAGGDVAVAAELLVREFSAALE